MYILCERGADGGTEMATDGIATEYVAWEEGKDSAQAFEGDVGIFLDLYVLYFLRTLRDRNRDGDGDGDGCY